MKEQLAFETMIHLPTQTLIEYNDTLNDKKIQKNENAQSKQCRVRHAASLIVSIAWHSDFLFRINKQIYLSLLHYILFLDVSTLKL